jgi:hypothetical protein
MALHQGLLEFGIVTILIIQSKNKSFKRRIIHEIVI